MVKGGRREGGGEEGREEAENNGGRTGEKGQEEIKLQNNEISNGRQ